MQVSQFRRPHLLPGILRMPGVKLFPRHARQVRFALTQSPADNAVAAPDPRQCVCTCKSTCKNAMKKRGLKAKLHYRKKRCNHCAEDDQNERQVIQETEFRDRGLRRKEHMAQESADVYVANAEVGPLTLVQGVNQCRNSNNYHQRSHSMCGNVLSFHSCNTSSNDEMKRRYEEYDSAGLGREVLQQWVFYAARCDRISVGRARRRLSPEVFSVLPMRTLHSLAFLCRESDSFQRVSKKMQKKNLSAHTRRPWEILADSDKPRSRCKCHHSEHICIRSMLVALVSHTFRVSLQLVAALPDSNLVDGAVTAVLIRIGAMANPMTCRKSSAKEKLLSTVCQKSLFLFSENAS